MNRSAFAVLSVLLFFAFQAQAQIPSDPRVERRVDELLSRMTLDEKIDLLSGNDMETHAIPRLGIPKLKMSDGPLGVRWQRATAFPSGISMGATFDPGLIREVAKAMAVETKALGRDMLLGPCVNISRVPHGGRNFESFGEDPFLTSSFASSYVQGLQSEQVLASTKHFLLNDQEFERITVDVQADERTMREIYLPPFIAAIEAGTWSIMASYNQVNGSWATENPDILQRILKDELGFQGFLVSDWGATHSTVEAANAGLDLEMPYGYFFDRKLRDAVVDGKVRASVIDDKVRRLLRAMISNGIFERKDEDRPPISAVNSPEHQALALKLAQESLVLLKNEDHLLPLKDRGVKTVAVIGPNAAFARTSGGGSSEVTPFHTVSPLQGLTNRLPGQVRIDYAIGARMPEDVEALDSSFLAPEDGGAQPGLKGEYFANRELKGAPVLTRVDSQVNFNWGEASPGDGIPEDGFSVRWTGKIRPDTSGNYELAVRADDGVRLYLDGKLVIDDWNDHGPTTVISKVTLQAGRSIDLKLEYYENAGGAQVVLGWYSPKSDELQKAVQAAAQADVALVFAGLSDQYESENLDRTSLELPAGQAELIQAIAKANANTVVILNSGGPLLMGSWIHQVKAVIQAWYPGEAGGNAIADVLWGNVNPSGKLPVSFVQRWEDSSAFRSYPGHDGVIRYAEGIFVGYRHLDRQGIDPLFPFGHGLSYTEFKYEGTNALVLDPSAASPEVEVTARITNTGARSGAEVVQLYVESETPEIVRPVQELKGFLKLDLHPGESHPIRFHLDRQAFQYFDETTRQWRVAPGKYRIKLGASSRDIRSSALIELR